MARGASEAAAAPAGESVPSAAGHEPSSSMQRLGRRQLCADGMQICIRINLWLQACQQRWGIGSGRATAAAAAASLHGTASTAAEGFLSAVHSMQRYQHHAQHRSPCSPCLPPRCALHRLLQDSWMGGWVAMSAQQQVLVKQEVLLVLPPRPVQLAAAHQQGA